MTILILLKSGSGGEASTLAQEVEQSHLRENYSGGHLGLLLWYRLLNLVLPVVHLSVTLFKRL